MRETRLFNDNWKFIKIEPGTTGYENSDSWVNVDIPHDWLIYDTNNLYEDSEGWYRKTFDLQTETGVRYALRFDGVYMEPVIYVNGAKAGEWKYGYNTFEIDITDYLVNGANEIRVQVMHRSPNSRWYSGAGIFRNIWFKTMPDTHFVSDGIYIRTERTDTGYMLKASSEISGSEFDAVAYTVFDMNGTAVVSKTTDAAADTVEIEVESPDEWDIDNPVCYVLRAELLCNGQAVDCINTRFGFRTIEFNSDSGFYLNGRHVKLNGVCMHHDLGALGAAVNKAALYRQLKMMKDMGANAIRTSHNMPAVELLDIADEIGLLVDNEAFDMWKMPKNRYDYARFFEEWAAKDMRNFVRRDRNHPCVIMWSIGNEIFDTHADEESGMRSTKLLYEAVIENDPDCNAYATFGSNFLEGEPTQRCADVLKLVGYNYSERLYDAHHKAHPDWCIYGSETGSTLQSRDVYHFPYSEPILTDVDEQCSSLGNSTCSWGAPDSEFCITTERDNKYSAGQFLWTGFDYIGEPTPYQTKNSYFGQVDTAGFPKDTYYIYRAEWTDYKTDPMVHIFPYWDFNEDQIIDVRATSNAPVIELFFNGISQGKFNIDHKHGKELLGHWRIPYAKGRIDAVAYDENGEEIARDTKTSFGDGSRLILKPDKLTLDADGEDMAFIEVNVLDADGNYVANANNRVRVEVSGAARLVGLDNGDSTDYDQYKGDSRKLFMGRLIIMAAAGTNAGKAAIKVTSPSLESAEIEIDCKEAYVKAGISANTSNYHVDTDANEIPIRKIEIASTEGTILDKEHPETVLTAKCYPSYSTYDELEWSVLNDAGVESNLAGIETVNGQTVLKARGDGEFNVKCYSRNGGSRVNVISMLGFKATGLGSASINPYETISAALYTIASDEMGNAGEHGVATLRHKESYIGFENVDFGSYGTDEVEINIFTHDRADFVVQLWLGIPGEEGSELILDGIYNKPVIWDVYQPEKYKLRHRIKGTHTLCLLTREFINIRDLVFTRPDKGFARIDAADNDKIYGDDFKISGSSVTGIGNNVSLDFDDMDFKDGVSRITIKGTSYTEVNTLNIIFVGEDGSQTRQMIEFTHTDDAEEKTFDINPIKGKNKVTFVFLPGSNFDFEWFRFE